MMMNRWIQSQSVGLAFGWLCIVLYGFMTLCMYVKLLIICSSWELLLYFTECGTGFLGVHSSYAEYRICILHIYFWIYRLLNAYIQTFTPLVFQHMLNRLKPPRYLHIATIVQIISYEDIGENNYTYNLSILFTRLHRNKGLILITESKPRIASRCLSFYAKRCTLYTFCSKFGRIFNPEIILVLNVSIVIFYGKNRKNKLRDFNYMGYLRNHPAVLRDNIKIK